MDIFGLKKRTDKITIISIWPDHIFMIWKLKVFLHFFFRAPCSIERHIRILTIIVRMAAFNGKITGKCTFATSFFQTKFRNCIYTGLFWVWNTLVWITSIRNSNIYDIKNIDSIFPPSIIFYTSHVELLSFNQNTCWRCGYGYIFWFYGFKWISGI